MIGCLYANTSIFRANAQFMLLTKNNLLCSAKITMILYYGGNVRDLQTT